MLAFITCNAYFPHNMNGIFVVGGFSVHLKLSSSSMFNAIEYACGEIQNIGNQIIKNF